MMRRSLLVLFALLVASAVVPAQIIAVHFKDEKHVKKYKDNITYVNGEPVLVGEARSGIVYDEDAGNLSFDPRGRNELYVADPSDPSKVPYKFDKAGEKVAKKKFVVGIDGPKIQRLSLLIRDDTLAGLSREYLFRTDQLEELLDERDEHDKGSESWYAATGRVLTHYERLKSWLEKTAYPEAAEKLEREIKKERKRAAGGAARARAKRALESIEMVGTPQELIAASQDLTDGRLRFKMQESQHLRITYLDRLSDSRVKALLEFGENLIEGYRNDFVDPYRDDDFADKIPDKIFHEFWFGPDDLKLHELFMVQYYGSAWGDDRKQERLESAGTRVSGIRGLTILDYWKLGEGRDLEGVVSHGLGHSLARLHYAGGSTRAPAWLEEASGYYSSFEYLGRNTVTCREFRDLKYLKPDPGEEGEKTVQRGMRELFNELALERGPTITKLALMTLFEMEDPDLAKSWSLFDYVARKEGKDGQLWLRAHCTAAGSSEKAMVPKWRELTEMIFGVTGTDVFKVIDDRWRDFAKRGQDKSGGSRKRA